MKRILGTALVSALLAGCHGAAGLPPAEGPVTGAATVRQFSGRAALRSPMVMSHGIVGSANTVTADMSVPRPNTKPCVVTLFRNYEFKDFNNQTFSYAPDRSCKGPWAKVVFNFDIGVTKGIQYDRTAIIWVGGAPIYFGTTAEPAPNLAPHWHVERDVTDLSALLLSASQGQIALGNCYCPPNYTGIQHGTASLQFYPANSGNPAPRVPDVVLGVPYSPPLGNVSQIPLTSMTISTKLPRNIVAADLDVYLQSQSDEEQWFMCVPDAIWRKWQHALGFCPNAGFREGEVAVDGTPAGTAPVYPWIYTGGMNPYLWFPLPGVQTLNFTPYRVPLSPFAGVLSNGSTHTISVTVARAFHYFSGSGDLLLYLDPKAKRVSGKVLSDTLNAKPPIRIHSNLKVGSGSGIFGGPEASGPVDVGSARDYTITGYVDGSSGRTTSTVHVRSSFFNHQEFIYNGKQDTQLLTQDMKLRSIETTATGSTHSITRTELEYPIVVAYPFVVKGSQLLIPTSVYQGYRAHVTSRGSASFESLLTNTVQSANTLIVTGSSVSGEHGSKSSQLYTYTDSSGICYGKEIRTKKNVVTAVSSPGCTVSPPPIPTPKPR